jgi:putative endonuclease
MEDESGRESAIYKVCHPEQAKLVLALSKELSLFARAMRREHLTLFSPPVYYVYIVTNKNHSVLYIGVTGFLAGRIHSHRARLIEGFTKRYQATKPVYCEDYPDPNSAIGREKQLKGWRREKKLALIGKLNPQWVDLFDTMIQG